MSQNLGQPAFAAHDVDETLRSIRILGIEEAVFASTTTPALSCSSTSTSRATALSRSSPEARVPTLIGRRASAHLPADRNLHAAVEHLRENGRPSTASRHGSRRNLQAWTRTPTERDRAIAALRKSPQRRTPSPPNGASRNDSVPVA